ncbi:prepilin-type N-terminal cleavage/methylation domain-containing protein [Photobacterium leiognathi]|uniref:prepilin-type N-terminal cleavage/methylation domain-containing protein n=1 Tax=Photobacterium leiognathi TaxID=553611 RepID=UPI00298180FF|nr:prepilin-type N-terminal cleavage/methylation domain-containing protein [Photobacterium leiognathi]
MSLAQNLKAKLNVQNDQKGFTLIELLVVLVVIAVLTLVGMAVKPKVMEMVSSYQLSSAMDTLSSEALAWKGGNANYTGFSLAKECANGGFSKALCGVSTPAGKDTPAKLADGSTANPFGGAYTAVADTANADHLKVTITKVPASMGDTLARDLKGHAVDGDASFTGGVISLTL